MGQVTPGRILQLNNFHEQGSKIIAESRGQWTADAQLTCN